jgi:hypothetical protein
VEPTVGEALPGNQRIGLPSDWESFKEAQRRYKRAIRCSKQESYRIICQGINDILTAWRLNKILTKDPRVRFGPLLLHSGEYTL